MAIMHTRTLGSTGFQTSEIGLGCWQLGGDCWGSVDDKTALEIMRLSVEGGVNFFDTADVYGAGRSEELIGRFLKDRPGKSSSPPNSGVAPSPAGLAISRARP